MSGPRRLDGEQAAKVSQNSLDRYRREAAKFTTWALELGFDPRSAEEFDDLLVEFKNSQPMTKGRFETLVAATEFFFPRYKGRLGWAHAVLSGWSVAHKTKHTVPLTYAPACLVATHLAALGYDRLGFGVILQRVKGLRPSEMLKVTPEAVMFPEEQGLDPLVAPTIICLGLRVGTKAKREQVVTLFAREHPELVVLFKVILC